MATEYTPNYNLDLYASADKPNLRDQYNAAMGKIDAQMKKSADDVVNANANVLTLQTQMTETQKDVSALTATVETHGTQITGAQKTADDALSLAQTNETDLAGTQADVTALTGRVTTVEGTATKNKVDIAALGTRVDGLQTDVSQKAPTNHVSSASIYGQGTPTMFGHLKVTDASTAAASTGTAASPFMVSQVGEQVNKLRADITAKPKSVNVTTSIANVSARYVYSPLASICLVKVFLSSATLNGGTTPLFTLPESLRPTTDYDGDVFFSKTANPYGRIHYNSSTGKVELYSYIKQDYDTSGNLIFFYGEVPSTVAPV
jgi:hypothetical protein|nr:MAG TPA_asm: tail-needle protein [Caudoviricetes sp.]